MGCLPHVVIGSADLKHRRLLQLGNAGIAHVVSRKCEGLLDDTSPYQRDLLERRLSGNADFVACVGLTAFLLDTVRNRHAGTVAAIDDGMNGTGVLDAAQVKVKQQAEFRLFQSEAAIGACASRRDLNGAGVT